MTRVPLVALHARFEEELQRRSAHHDLAHDVAGLRARWVSSVRFTERGFLVCIPLLSAAFLIDRVTGATLRTFALRAPLTDTNHDSLLAFHIGDLVVLEHGALASHAGDRVNTLHLFHADAEAPHASIEPHGPTGEMSWAVNPQGTRLVTVGFDDESERLVAELFDSNGKRLRRTRVGAEDETFLGPVCLGSEDQLAIAAEFGLQLRKLGATGKIAKWKSPGPLSSIVYPASTAVALGIEQGKQGVVWKFRTDEKPSVIGVQLAAEAPVRFLGISKDESFSWWLATAADGARDLFRLNHKTAETERAALEPNEAWNSFDSECHHVAFVDAGTIIVESIRPSWTTVSSAEQARDSVATPTKPKGTRTKSQLPAVPKGSVLVKAGEKRYSGYAFCEAVVVTSMVEGIGAGSSLFVSSDRQAKPWLVDEESVLLLLNAKPMQAFGERVVLSLEQEGALSGIVVSAGPMTDFAPPLRPGDRAFFGKNSGRRFERDGKAFILQPAYELLAAVEADGPVRALGGRLLGRRSPADERVVVVLDGPNAGASVRLGKYYGVDIEHEGNKLTVFEPHHIEAQ